jgi:hypothetical protein
MTTKLVRRRVGRGRQISQRRGLRDSLPLLLAPSQYVGNLSWSTTQVWRGYGVMAPCVGVA